MMLYADDIAKVVAFWNVLLIKLAGRDALDGIEDEAWAVARKSEDIPHVGNIITEITAQRLGEAILTLYPLAEIEYYIDGQSSSFSLDGWELQDFSDYHNAIEEYLLEVA